MQLHVHTWGTPDAPLLVCLHGVTAHGRRFRRLAEERWAERFHVVAPDLRGHGRSNWEPPWDLGSLALDVVETCGSRGIWLGHSLGGRLVLEVAAQWPELVERAVLLDPALQILPNVALDLAEQQCQGGSFASIEEAVDARAATAPGTPRSFLEEEMAEHLVESRGGRYRLRYARAAAATIYGELATPPPDPASLSAPTLLVHAPEFGLVRDEQLLTYQAALGDRLEIVPVPGGHIVYWDAYDQTAQAVEGFIESGMP